MSKPNDSSAKIAIKIAEAITAKFRVGTFSRFMDEPAEFDDAAIEKITAIIRPHIQEYASRLWQINPGGDT